MTQPTHQPMRTQPLLSAALVAATIALSCTPAPSSGTRPRSGATIADYITVRAHEGGAIGPRDLPPTPQPREAITRDDYFAIKLEHIFLADDGRSARRGGLPFSNLAVITEIGGILPASVDCTLIPEAEVGFTLSDPSLSNIPGPERCAYKNVVQINPVFSGAHATFDSVFISPPFRTDNRPVELRFILAELRDVELAQQVVDWAESMTSRLVPGMNAAGWRQDAVNVGFSAVHYLLERAATPTYVFELSTDFVPVETVEGGVPQNLFMQSDFVVMGQSERAPMSALRAGDTLTFSSGRLYHADTREEYRDTPYVVYRVVRFSRFPGALPVSIPDVVRALSQGADAVELQQDVGLLLDDLQYARLVNETEGLMLRQTVDWLLTTNALTRQLDELTFPVDPVVATISQPGLRTPIEPLGALETLASQVAFLDERLYANFGQTPGYMQDECVALRRFTQEAADVYALRLAQVKTGLEALQIVRYRAQQDARDSALARELGTVEAVLQARIDALPDPLPEPDCPTLRAAYPTP